MPEFSAYDLHHQGYGVQNIETGDWFNYEYNTRENGMNLIDVDWVTDQAVIFPSITLLLRVVLDDAKLSPEDLKDCRIVRFTRDEELFPNV